MVRGGIFKKVNKILSIFVILVLCFLIFIICFEVKVHKGVPIFSNYENIYIINFLEIKPKGETFSCEYFAFVELINYRFKGNLKKRYKYLFKSSLIPINMDNIVNFKKDGIKYDIDFNGFDIEINVGFCINSRQEILVSYRENDKYIIGIFYVDTDEKFDKYKICIYNKNNKKSNCIIESANPGFNYFGSRLRGDYFILIFGDFETI